MSTDPRERDRHEELDRRVADRYLIHPGQRDAFHNDVNFHLHVDMIRDMIHAVDKSLAAEHVGLETRDRVCYRLLFGEAPEGFTPPDFREGHNRMVDRFTSMVRMMQQPLDLGFKLDGGPGV
jgi:hypothetical protein